VVTVGPKAQIFEPNGVDQSDIAKVLYIRVHRLRE
jgi:hypothetical protein